MKFCDIFNPIEKGNHGLTEEAAYAAINLGLMVPLYGGNSQHRATERYISERAATVDGQPMRVFDGEGIIISLDGSAGCMTYKSGERFALNHHAGFITLRPEARQRVNLRYFAAFMQNHYKSIAVSSGSKTLSLSQIYSDEFELPDKATQDELMAELGWTMRAWESLSDIKSRLDKLLVRQITATYRRYQVRDVPLRKVLDYMGGNSGLTEEFLYNNLAVGGPRYKILTGATLESKQLGQVPLCSIAGRPLRVFENREGLLVVRKGKAGSTVYLTPDRYTLNDDAYILFVHDSCPYDIDLHWLAIQYRSEFMAYASAADNGTWNMTGFFDNVRIDIPEHREQLQLVGLYKRAHHLQRRIDEIHLRLQTLMAKEIE
ncbi:MAG: restriction endonuclease subunit S [Bacteroidaceae bacterium]|nr:restriction endonuclease subunit S [Bacteroidaceae bacterium]